MIDVTSPHASLRASRDTTRRSWFPCLLVVVGLIVGVAAPACAQSSAVTGYVRDETGQVLAGALVTVTNEGTNVPHVKRTNDIGYYAVTNLEPGLYTVRVEATGFQTTITPGVRIDVGVNKGLDVALQIGRRSDAIEVPGRESRRGGSMSTLIDRQFVANLPLNGRSLQTLIGLVPGVTMTVSTSLMSGQFSVNGQRTTTNQVMVDGVSANFGVTPTSGNGQAFAGTQPALTASGGTNGLVSVDAVEQFRVHTSTYAPEFGRSPGGQVQIVTRSGTNRPAGSAAEYFRNDALDANDWFANAAHLPKARLNQHDFTGVLGGPIHRDSFFYFLSYEGLWLQQPRSVVGQVPSLAMRQTAAASLRPTIEAFPLPNGPELIDPTTGTQTGLALYTANSSDRVRFNAFSVRLDYRVPPLSVFARFKQSPSNTTTHVATGNTLDESSANLRTFTVGVNAALSSRFLNEFRVNYSWQQAIQQYRLDALAGAVVPAATMLFPSIAIPERDLVNVHIDPSDGTAILSYGVVGNNRQYQAQAIDTISAQWRTHNVKIGADYRFLETIRAPGALGVTEWFDTMTDVQMGRVSLLSTSLQGATNPHVRNFSLFAQDTWLATPRFTLTYGVRWDINPPPGAPRGEEAFVVKGLGSPATYAPAPRGTALYPIRYTNVAPRISVTIPLRENGWGTLLSVGGGLFYDAGNDAAMRAYGQDYPFIATNSGTSVSFASVMGAVRPQLPSTFTPPYNGSFTSYTDDFKTPVTRQWNVALEQQLCSGSEVSVGYVGAHGEHLLRQEQWSQPTPAFGASVYIIRSDATSDYNALQIQFTRRMSMGLQASAGYVWSHSNDMVSDALTNVALRGPSDFDIRHAFNAAFTYALPRRRGRLLDLIVGGWVLSGIARWRSAPPVNLTASSMIRIDGVTLDERPDLLPNMPLYIVDASLPGGRGLNATIDPSRPGCVGPFCQPAAGTQGNLGRNVVRGFPASQIDLSVRRALPLMSNTKVSVAVEAFNLLNHPNFGPPTASITSGQFGQPTAMLSRGLGGLSPIYQIGGPRSLQLSARLEF